MESMPYYFADKPSHGLRKIIEADLKLHWSPYELADVTYPYATADLAQLRHILVPLAYGETTALHGFGNRIASADDATLKLWLATHLLDETRHTVAFSSYLDRLGYDPVSLTDFPYRHVIVFYGRTDKMQDIHDWIFCTISAEVFGKYLYTALQRGLPDACSQGFFANIVNDEKRHIGFLKAYLTEGRKAGRFTVDTARLDGWHDVIGRCRDMFETRRRGPSYAACGHFAIPISAFCDAAEEDLRQFAATLAKP